MNYRAKLEEITQQYRGELLPSQRKNIERLAHTLSLVVARKGTDITICDAGGGLGVFSVGCASLGMNTILIDDFRDPINYERPIKELGIHEKYGVDVRTRDLLTAGLGLEPESVDVITMLELIEHLHHSPKKLLHSAVQALKPGGLLLISVPNCMALHQRLRWLLGRGYWSTMPAWYEQEQFRDHVREPSVADLRYFARDLGLKNVEILGCYWALRTIGNKLLRRIGRVVEPILRLRPTLCGKIYLLGTKP